MRKRWALLIAAMFLAVLCGTKEVTATKYVYKDLGTLGGDLSEGWGINDAGQVAGVANTLNGDTHAFLWTPGSPMRDLGALEVNGTSSAHAINQCVVGFTTLPNDRAHAFRWLPSQGMQDLGALVDANNGSYAYGTNKTGQVVGDSYVGGYVGTHGFLWENGVMKDLGTFGGTSSTAKCINNKGQIAGSYYDSAAGETRGYLRDLSSAWQGLGSLGGSTTVALGINDAGHVVGYSDDTNYLNHAFFWTPGPGMQDLGTLGGNASTALGINNFDQVVGWAYAPLWDQRAFVWTKQTGMQDLNKLVVNLPSNVVLLNATAINNLGQIVGFTRVKLLNHAFLLTPLTVSNVPMMMLLLMD
jgi:probable HAF family extracellular repeat protein